MIFLLCQHVLLDFPRIIGYYMVYKKGEEKSMKDSINQKKLYSLAFTDEEIDYLEKNSFLKKTKGRNYTCLELHNLIYFSRQQRYKFNKEFADKILRLCYYFDPKDFKVNYELFYISIKSLQFNESVPYLRYLIEHAAAPAKNDYNVYLYLLSMIISLPEDLKRKALALREKDLLVTDLNRKDIKTENYIRKKIFSQKFKGATIESNKYSKTTGNDTQESYIRYILTGYANNKQLDNKRALEKLIKSGKYIESIKFLEDLSLEHQLSLIERYTLKVLKDILRLRYTHLLPKERAYFQTDNLNIYDAIDCGDYYYAMEFAENYSRMNGNILYQSISDMLKELESFKSGFFDETQDLNIALNTDIFIELTSKGISLKTIMYVLNISSIEYTTIVLGVIKELYETDSIQEANVLLEKVQSSLEIMDQDRELYEEVKKLKKEKNKKITLNTRGDKNGSEKKHY